MPSDTTTRITTAAERLMKLHGYHGFSYADVADEVGIRKASIHHHFRAKPDLAIEVVRRYRRAIADALDAVAAEGDSPGDRLRGFAAIFEAAFAAPGSMCLCAALTADWDGLPDDVRAEVEAYWRESRAWLAAELFESRSPVSPRTRAATANAVISLLEGALLCARADDDPTPIHDAVRAAEVLLTHAT